MELLRSPGCRHILGLSRNSVDRVEEGAKFCGPPVLFLDAIDFQPMLHARLIRRHARVTELVNYPCVSAQLGDFVHSLLAIIEELCRSDLVSSKEGGTYSRFPGVFSVLF